MVDHRQIHSTISAALTSIDELSDDECLALLLWIQLEIGTLTMTAIADDEETYQLARRIADDQRAAAAPAIAKLQQLLTR